jgi:dTDP-glucose 4,6-dehydratase
MKLKEKVLPQLKDWIEENTIFNPSTPYAVSRAAGDMHLINYINQKKFPAIITRTANVYGPGQQIYRIVPKAIISALSNRKLMLDGGGSSVRSFIYIDDASEATLKLCTEGKIGETYHISTQKTVSIRELVEIIFLITGQNFEESVAFGDDRLGKDFGYLLKSDKIRNQLMWQDQISLKFGLENTIQWVRDNLDYLLKQPTEYKHKE